MNPPADVVRAAGGASRVTNNEQRRLVKVVHSGIPKAALVMVVSILSASASNVVLIPLGTTNRADYPRGTTNWHYRSGTSEASAPLDVWRTNMFNEDGSWNVGSLPLGYATSANDPNGYEATLVTIVPAATTCVFVRRIFVITNAGQYLSLTVSGFADDGVVVWINGTELTPRFQCCTGGTDANVPTFNSLATAALESPPFNYTIGNNASGPLVEGTNIIAIQLFNANNTSSDLVLDVSLSGSLDGVAPVITAPPSDQSRCVSQSAAFQVTGQGSGPLDYRWYFNRTNLLAGETNVQLNLANLQTNQAGLYSAAVSNGFGSVTSAPARLLVFDACVGINLYAGMSVTGIVGRTYVIDWATNLSGVNWTPMATNTFTTERWLFIDTNTPVIPGRFFRVRLVP